MNSGPVFRLFQIIRPWVAGVLLMVLFASPLVSSTRADGGLALQFDGVNDYAAFGDTGDFMGTDAWTSAKTVSMWIRLTSATAPATSPTSGEMIAGNDSPRSFGISRAVYNGQDKIWLWNSDSNAVDIVGIDFTLGEWMQIALVHSGGVLYAYKNGALVGSVASGTTYIPSTTTGDGKLFVAGSGRTSAAYYIEAQIDEVSFWNTALDAGTIQAWWNREVTSAHPYFGNLAGYYQMTDGAGTLLSDNSGHGHTGTLLGGMSDANWVPSGALVGSPPVDTPTPTETFTPAPPTDTPTATVTPAPPTDTPTPTETFTPAPPTDTPTSTVTPVPPTDTPTSTATFTPAPPTDTPTSTATPVPPTDTPTPTATFTSAPPTDTPTFTAPPPTDTPTSTATPVPPTDTPTPTATFTPTATATATSTPTATATPAPSPTPPPGNGYALQFDGNNDFVKLRETYLMLPPGWENTKTVSLWIRPMGTAPACYRNDVAMCDNIFGDRPRWWGIARGVIFGEDRIWLFNTDGGTLTFTDRIGIPYTPGDWVHIALVHSNGVMHAYKNGVEVGSIASGTTQQPTNNAHPVLHIGGVINNSSRNWTYEGLIDAVKVWNIGMTASQVQQDMNQVLTGAEPGLDAYYRMSNGSGLILTDDSIYSWDGTLYDGGNGVPPDGSPPQWIPPGVD